MNFQTSSGLDLSAETPIECSTFRILVALDLSNASSYTLQYAIRLARSSGTGLNLLHVVQPPKVDSSFPVLGASGRFPCGIDLMLEIAQSRLQDLQDKLLEDNIPSRVSVRVGLPVQEILAEAAETHPDLILVGRNQGSSLARFFLGSTAEQVVHGARCPVLVASGTPAELVA